MWAENIDWDSKIEGKRKDDFLYWLRDLLNLRDVEIPRKLGKGEVTLHVFGDASGSAYATVVYARVVYEGAISISLLGAKSRVAPKKATIPRLELMAATIATRLASTIVTSLTRNVEKITYWTDSTTVLAWIKRDMQWNTFVWNRVKEIRSVSDGKDWKHVPSHLNPADLPSRGCNSSQLKESEWWLGPSWLREPEPNWPTTILEFNEDEVRSEIKKTTTVHMVNLQETSFKVSDHFSSYTQLITFAAWTQRFVNNCRDSIATRKSEQNTNKPIKPKPEKISLTFKERQSKKSN